MRCALQTTLFSLTLLAGLAASAYAQGVANLPPAGAPPATAPPAYSAPTVGGPNPGSNVSIPSTPSYQKPADYDSNRNYHPYSTSGGGPNPGSNVSANNEPFTPPAGADTPASHPYSPGGAGPNPGR
jgi:hypothetical protein